MSVPHIDEADLPQDGLYHYTNAGGLYGILTDEKLWATHAAYLNDSQEFLFGMGLIQEELKNFERELKVTDTSSDPEFSDLVAMMPPAISRGCSWSFKREQPFCARRLVRSSPASQQPGTNSVNGVDTAPAADMQFGSMRQISESLWTATPLRCRLRLNRSISLPCR